MALTELYDSLKSQFSGTEPWQQAPFVSFYPWAPFLVSDFVSSCQVAFHVEIDFSFSLNLLYEFDDMGFKLLGVLYLGLWYVCLSSS